MKFVYEDIADVFDINTQSVNSLVIENQELFYRLIEDITNQISGEQGRAVLSENDSPVDFGKNAEIITTFVPFEINRKTLLTKITGSLEKTAISADFYQYTLKILSSIEQYLDQISFGYDCNLEYNKLSISNILKSVGIELTEDYNSLPEKIIDYMELVREFDREKLFITVNMRSYISDKDTEDFLTTVLDHEFKLFMIENKEYALLKNEKRHIIDADLCEI